MFAQINCPGFTAHRLGQSDEFLHMNGGIGLVRPGEIAVFMRMNSRLLGRETVDGKVTLSEQNWCNLSECQGTSPDLHPKVTAADPRTIFGLFDGEGAGAHTHMPWPWNLGSPFQFFVHKLPGKTPDTTDTSYYIYDRFQKSWLHSATITNPNDDKKSVATIGGGLNSFLENFTGEDRAVPKLALYRLWLGPSVEKMKCLTRADGDGIWGQFRDAYFLAEGDHAALNDVFARWKKKYGQPVMGEVGKNLGPLSDVRLANKLIVGLKKLPHANAVRNEQEQLVTPNPPAVP
jgi:hypothetical protein